MEEFIKSVWFSRGIESIIAVVVGILIYRLYIKVISTGIQKNILKDKVDNKKITYIRLFNNIFKYVIIFVVILIILQINGINVTSLLAGVGIVGIVVGLALQDALKDIIMGSHIITDNFFSVGDVVKFKDFEGKVLVLGLKTTKIQNIATKDILSISNRDIDKIVNLSMTFDLEIPISYDEKIEKVEETLNKAVDQIKELDNVKECKYLGVSQFDTNNIIYKIRINCMHEYKPSIKSKALRIIKILIEENDLKTSHI